ncbi:VOC family protein [Streptomyces sp. NPDC127097]|uniref:VOC family protein n=1 Tax=Streptomyces sp. NPDC127097 TaxID=3347136 RepID=UPI0036576A40
MDEQSWVRTDRPDEVCARARAAGAEIIEELSDTDYGSREFGVRDPEGNLWSFGTYRGEPRRVSPGPRATGGPVSRG